MKSLCLPEQWLEYFNDLALVAVLAAHRDAQPESGAYIALTELQCAARTRLDRKTVHKKKRELIAEGVLVPKPGSGRGWQGLPCLIAWARLSQLTEKGQLNWPERDNQLPINGQSETQKGTIDWPERDNQPTRNGQSTGQKGTIENALSLFSLEDLEEASCPAQTVEKTQIERDIRQTIAAARLYDIQGEQLDDDTVRNLMAVFSPLPPSVLPKILNELELKCRDLVKFPNKARGWGYVVNGMRMLADKMFPRVTERKPPVREDETSDVLAIRQVAELKQELRSFVAKGMR